LSDLFQSAASAESERPEALLRAVLICDLIESTALVERLGDRAAADLMSRHDRLARAALQRHDGREVDKTDGFLLLFDRPIQAIAFALEYQRELAALARQTGQPLAARVGIHVGEVMVWANAASDVARGAKPIEVEGLAKTVAARLMALALPGQILLSAVAYTLARRGEHELRPEYGNVRWLPHGRYQVKGIHEPVTVYEVGETDVAPLRHPPDSSKAWRPKALWRSPLALAAVGAVMVAAAAVPVFLTLRSQHALGFNERDWVVVGEVVNINADKRLDAVLGTAFRIGIEQSRFINVVPDMQVRQALDRMQRPPTTPIDREMATEIAVREHARAVIVPSVTQSGRVLRLSAEIVDPQRGRTVWVQTSDADGPDNALPAMDRLLRDLRSTLGESLAQIESTTQPLAQVSTPNLDALRAYSRALQLARLGDFSQATGALNHATELDPNFAAAYAFQASVLYSQERWPEARAALEKALSIDGRLTDRSRLYARGMLSHFTDPRSALDSWQMYANLYPDQPAGPNNSGNECYMHLHDYACAEAAYRKAASMPHPLRNYALVALADVLVAQEKLDEAIEQHRAAAAFSPAPAIWGLACALTAAGRLDDAQRYLDGTSRQPAAVEVEREMRRATLLVARGNIEAARATVMDVIPDAARVRSPHPRWRAQAALIALHAAVGDNAKARELAARHLAELAPSARDAYPGAIEALLYAAGWGARLGLADQAREALTLARQVGALTRFPVRAQLALLAEEELNLKTDAAGVAARLQPSGKTSELWELHELRARAFRASGDVSREMDELRWLAAHPGLAQTQWTDQWLGQQARQVALRDAVSRLAAYGKRSDGALPNRLTVFSVDSASRK
jgi:putative peptide modification system cyclase